MEPSPAKGSFRLSERGFQKSQITNAILSAITANLIGVYLNDLSQREEFGVLHGI